jgi:hypothetical protein
MILSWDQRMEKGTVSAPEKHRKMAGVRGAGKEREG